MPYKCQLPDMHSILANVDLPEDMGEFWRAVAVELAELMRYGSEAKEPQIVMSEGRQAGDQHIWEFWVNDLAMPQQQHYNWHGQNVSQWQYAGAIVLQDGQVSRHH